MAIVGSSFSEVLWLDADNTVLRNPEFLFDSPEFRSTGAMFWPDMYSISEKSAIWAVMGVPFRKTWAQESGQILLDKTRVWRELLVTALMNQRQEFFYSLVNGDKDTFLFSWLATGSPFFLVPFPPFPAGIGSRDHFCGNSFIQSDPSGRPLFIHAVNAKAMPTNTVNRKWRVAKPFDPERAAPIYVWEGACIDVDSMGEPASVSIVPFSSICGNIEDAANFFHRRSG